MIKRLAAEFLGTFWLVLGGCGSAVLAANFGGDGNPLGIGLLGVSLAFGLTVLTGAYAFGHISGAHFNPAVSIGLWAGGRFPLKDLVPYIAAQVVGAIFAGWILFQIASGTGSFAIDPAAAGAFASNGYGALSPGGYSVAAAFLCEVVLTAMFLVVILGATHRARAGWIRTHRDRPGAHPDPPRQHPGHQYLGESGALDRRGVVRRQRCDLATLAVLAGTDPRWPARRRHLRLARQGQDLTTSACNCNNGHVAGRGRFFVSQ